MTVRSNSFDPLRLIAALMVLWSHQFALSGTPEVYSPAFNGGVGVTIFFAISGYLNVTSLIDNPPWWRFLLRRARRIYPALGAFSVFCVALGFTVTVAPDIFWAKVPRFLFKNSTILFGIDYYLPGVFDNSRGSNTAMNGSLWTLPIEIKLYIYLAIIAAIFRYKTAFLLAAFASVFVALLVWFKITGSSLEAAHSQRLTLIFLTGGLYALVERIWNIPAAILTLVSITVVTTTTSTVGALPAIALAAVLAGKAPCPPWLRPPIDISYGVYLYAFPVQQLTANSDLSFWLSLLVSVAATIALATLSALLIERPSIRLGDTEVRKLWFKGSSGAGHP